ncbi:MAG: hypothetical protein ACFFER_08130, partial [Candidatus Thorarchaeota archaeon]
MKASDFPVGFHRGVQEIPLKGAHDVRRIVLLIGLAVLTLYPCLAGNRTSIPPSSGTSAPTERHLQAGDSEEFVDNAISNVDLISDKGTHSSFPDQQSAPDSVYDILNESDTANPFGSEWLDVNSLDSTWTGWETNGTSPYLDAQDATTNMVMSKQNRDQMGWWDFDNTSLSGTLHV